MLYTNNNNIIIIAFISPTPQDVFLWESESKHGKEGEPKVKISQNSEKVKVWWVSKISEYQLILAKLNMIVILVLNTLSNFSFCNAQISLWS